MKYKTISLLLAMLIVFSFAAGCGTNSQEPSEEPSNRQIKIIDSMNREVVLEKVPEKIVSLTPSNTELLFALGVEDKIVGVSEWTDYPPEATSLPVVGAFNDPNVELILEKQPDLVLAGNKLQAESLNKLEELGIPFAAIEGTTYEEVLETITLVGKLVGKEDKAKEIVDTMVAKANSIKEAVSSAEKPTVYFVLYYGQDNYTSGPGSFVNELIEMAGGDPITKDAPVPWPNYSMEKLIEKDPDIILVSSDVGDIEGVKNAEGYRDLTAVKEGRVYMIESGPVMRPGPRLADGLESIAKILHPDLVGK